jgi:uncharacterized protein YndB with AHSA1/START domain
MEREMAGTLVARVSLTIDAPKASVWDALVNPEKIKQYILVSDVVSEWRVGSPIVWRSEFQGRPFEMRGKVVRLEPEHLVEYDRSLPIFRTSKVSHSSEAHHRVTIELSGEGARTHLSLIERGNKNERELAHSEGGWRMALGNMKALLEGTSIVPMR